ncbi:MAG: feruloyl-CoA synthase [Myxococcales bacterium]|nr:feruloyl-CoA synthase [Myxococcales bacterium]
MDAAAALKLLPPAVDVEARADGARILRSPVALGPYPRTLSERFFHWAAEAPERVFLAERSGSSDAGWRSLTYGEAAAAILELGQGLCERGLDAGRPLAILSDNSVDAGLLLLAAAHVGVPAMPISPAYSLLSQDLGKIRAIGRALRPALVYADDGERYGRALAALAELGGAPLVGGEGIAALRRPVAEEVARRHAATGPDTVAKILFTSGSTGAPKGVINTQRMLCANQQAISQLWPFLEATPPVLVDWLPWNHTFGGNHNFNMVVFHGGTLYIDPGKPAPGLIDRTIACLREVSPTLYFNVPRGFDALMPALEADAALRERFFARLQVIFYAAAALPQSLWARLEAVSQAAIGRKVFMASAWGATETAPLVTSVHFPIDHAGVIGLPAPGAELKLVPVASKLEVRVRAPWVTPGYHGEPELSAAAFDEEGFYRTGDAVAFADPEAPARGLTFAGRIAEDFKLTSGTWVNVGSLRVEVIAATSPAIQDAVITGEGREAIGALLFPSLAGARAVAGRPQASLAELCEDSALREHVRAGLARHNQQSPQSSRRIARALLLAEPPVIDAGEITDKGYINQRAVRERRAAEAAAVDRGGDPAVIEIER